MEKKKASKKRKPLYRARNWRKPVFAMAGKILLLLVVTIILGLMFSGLQTLENAVLRMVLCALILSGMFFLFYSEGLNEGVRNAGESRRVEQILRDNRPLPDDSNCYQPLKALSACLLVFAIPLGLAVFVAVVSKPYTYVLQDLPTWLTSGYGNRTDIMAPLDAYMKTTAPQPWQWVRMVVRIMEMLFIGFFQDPQLSGQLIDRLSPCFLLVYPVGFMLGYLRAPARYAKLEAQQRKAKKVAVRKAGKKSLAEELTSGGGEVHYGQRNDVKKEQRKLI